MPSLRTLHKVERILRTAQANDEGPLLLEDIYRRLGTKGVGRASVRTCVDELKRLNFVAEDRKRGVMWVLYEDPEFWARKRWMKL